MEDGEGFRSGSKKEEEASGCGFVIKCVDTKNWITITIIAVPLEMRSALSAEVPGVCILTDVLNRVFTKQKCYCKY